MQRIRQLARSNFVTSRRLGAIRWHGGPQVAADAPKVTMTFVQGEKTHVVEALVGESLLQTSRRNDLDLEGACEGGKLV